MLSSFYVYSPQVISCSALDLFHCAHEAMFSAKNGDSRTVSFESPTDVHFALVEHYHSKGISTMRKLHRSYTGITVEWYYYGTRVDYRYHTSY